LQTFVGHFVRKFRPKRFHKIDPSANGKCLAVQHVSAGAGVVGRARLVGCDPNSPEQEWTFTRYKKTGLKYTDLK
jgi:hypothetical protein